MRSLLGVPDAVANAIVVQRALEGFGLGGANRRLADGAGQRLLEVDSIEHAHKVTLL